MPYLHLNHPGANRVTARMMRLGYVRRVGHHVAVSHVADAYVVRRSPWHPAGHAVESFRTLKDAMAYANGATKEDKNLSAQATKG